MESLNSLSLSTKNSEVLLPWRWLLGWRGWLLAKPGVGAPVRPACAAVVGRAVGTAHPAGGHDTLLSWSGLLWGSLWSSSSTEGLGMGRGTTPQVPPLVKAARSRGRDQEPEARGSLWEPSGWTQGPAAGSGQGAVGYVPCGSPQRGFWSGPKRAEEVAVCARAPTGEVWDTYGVPGIWKGFREGGAALEPWAWV